MPEVENKVMSAMDDYGRGKRVLTSPHPSRPRHDKCHGWARSIAAMGATKRRLAGAFTPASNGRKRIATVKNPSPPVLVLRLTAD